MNAAVAGIELGLARAALAALGPKPPGHPADFKRAATLLRVQEEALQSAARATRGLPSGMDYTGPQALQFASHTAACAGVCGHATGELAEIAGDLVRQGEELQHHQQQWQRAHDALATKISALAAAVARGD